MPKGDATYPAMTIDECLAFADEWSRGMTSSADSQGWRVVCMLLAEEVREMRADLAEQCRLLGMGSEREARLMAQLAEGMTAASSLAMHIWDKHYKADAPNFGLCDSLPGVISQIDNMYAGLRNQLREAHEKELRELIEKARREERESIIAEMPGGHSVDPQWVCDMIRARGDK